MRNKNTKDNGDQQQLSAATSFLPTTTGVTEPPDVFSLRLQIFRKPKTLELLS